MFGKQRRRSSQAHQGDTGVKENKHWAKEYILDPLTAPQPSEECGPGSTFITPGGASLDRPRSQPPLYDTNSPSYTPRSSFEYITTPCTASRYPNEPTRRHEAPVSRSRSRSRSRSLATTSGDSPRSSSRKYPPQAYATRGRAHSIPHGSKNGKVSPPKEKSPPSTVSRSNSTNVESTSDPLRPSSLSRRFTVDLSLSPLDKLRKQSSDAARAAHRVSSEQGPFDHIKAKRRSRGKPFADTIDHLDHTSHGGTFHHDGPYDAAHPSRNANPANSPLEAVKDSNMEALKATPIDRVIDSITHNVPLHGTATIPPGMADPRTGEVLDYQEGADLMREPDAAGGAYKRWPGLIYRDDDLKGKGEPSWNSVDTSRERRRSREPKEPKQRSKKDRSRPPRTHSNHNNSSRALYEMQSQTGSGSSTNIRHRRRDSTGSPAPEREQARRPESSGRSSSRSSSRRRRHSATVAAERPRRVSFAADVSGSSDASGAETDKPGMATAPHGHQESEKRRRRHTTQTGKPTFTHVPAPERKSRRSSIGSFGDEIRRRFDLLRRKSSYSD